MKVTLVLLSLIFWDEVRAQTNKDVGKYLPKKQCDTMHVLASSLRGACADLLLLIYIHYYDDQFSTVRIDGSLLPGHSGEDAVVMRFGSIKQLLEIKDDKNLAAVLASSSCLSVIAQAKQVADISSLVDFVSASKVKNKYLMVQTPQLNVTLLRTRKINFNVMINEVDSGKNNISFNT